MTTITWQSITATAASLKPVKNDKNRAAVKTRQSDTPPKFHISRSVVPNSQWITRLDCHTAVCLPNVS